MKHLSVILVCCFLFFSNHLLSQAPNYLWATSEGGSLSDASADLVADPSGNSYVTGLFRSPTILFGSTTLVNTDATGNTSDIFIVKYDVLGNVIWAKSAGGLYNDAGWGITADTLGNIIMTGYFSGPTAIFDADTLTSTTTGLADIFLVKYNSSGNVLWAKKAGGTGVEGGHSVTAGKSGDIFLAGWFASPTLTIGSTTLTRVGSYDPFIAKYDASGNAIWAKSAGGAFDDRAYDITCDVNGNAIITGVFQSDSIVFAGNTIYHSDSANVFDSFVVKYDPSGNALWAQSVNGNMGEISVDVTTDFNGNIYTTGAFTEDSFYAGGPILDGNKSDAFLAKHDSSGNLIWLKTFVGPLASCGRVACDTFGNVCVLGTFAAEKLGFGIDTIVNSNTNTTLDLFVTKFDSLGNTIWIKPAGGLINESVSGLFINADGSVLASGSFDSPVLPFGATTLYNSTTDTIADIFLLKLENSTTGIDGAFSKNNGVSFYPNPFSSSSTLEIKDFKNDFSVLYLFDIAGREVYKKQITNRKTEIQKGNLNPGIYFYKVVSEGNSTASGKIIIQ